MSEAKKTIKPFTYQHKKVMAAAYTLMLELVTSRKEQFELVGELDNYAAGAIIRNKSFVNVVMDVLGTTVQTKVAEGIYTVTATCTKKERDRRVKEFIHYCKSMSDFKSAYDAHKKAQKAMVKGNNFALTMLEQNELLQETVKNVRSLREQHGIFIDNSKGSESLGVLYKSGRVYVDDNGLATDRTSGMSAAKKSKAEWLIKAKEQGKIKSFTTSQEKLVAEYKALSK